MPCPSPFPEIVCTLGSTTDERRVVEGMITAGMGMARLNTAYARLEEIEERIDLFRGAADRLGRGGLPVLLDLKGPQLRVECTTSQVDATGESKELDCRYPIAQGDLIFVGMGAGPVRFNHDIRNDLEPGDLVSFENGTIRTRVVDAALAGIEPQPDAVLLKVLEEGGGYMTPHMGASVPGKFLRVPRLTARDLEAIDLGVRRGVELYALSFAREPEDLLALHLALLERGDGKAGLVAKIEEANGVANLEPLVRAGSAAGREVAIMVARGDLFVEFPRAKLFAVQGELVGRCAALGVPSIVATGLLLSLQEGTRPTRSEVCDVASALTQGATSLLLSDETSNGKNPELAVRVLAEILREYRPARAEEPFAL